MELVHKLIQYTSIDDQFGNNIATASSNGMTSLVNSYDTLATNTDFPNISWIS